MQQRRIPDLDVTHVFRRDVDDEFIRHPFQRLRGLQDRQRDLVLAEVVLEALGVAHEHRFRERVGSVGGQTDALRARQLQHGRGSERAIEMHVQLGLGPASQSLFGETRLPFALRRHHHTKHRAGLTDRIAGIDRPAGGIGHIGGAIEQPRQTVIRLRDGVAHSSAARHVDCFVVDENPHQRSVRWKRTSAGASTGAGSAPR